MEIDDERKTKNIEKTSLRLERLILMNVFETVLKASLILASCILIFYVQFVSLDIPNRYNVR